MITKIKAIEILKHDIYLDKRGMTYSHDAIGIEAHEMAIKALESKIDVLDKIRSDIQAMSTDYCGGYIGLDKQEVLQIIEKYRKEQE